MSSPAPRRSTRIPWRSPPFRLKPSPATASAVDTLEERLEQALGSLEAMSPSRPSTSQIEDHLALFTRWCFRPVAKRIGEASSPILAA